MPYLHLFNDKADKLCKRNALGRSFQTDGTEAILQYIKLKTLKLRGAQDKADECKKRRN